MSSASDLPTLGTFRLRILRTCFAKQSEIQPLRPRANILSRILLARGARREQKCAGVGLPTHVAPWQIAADAARPTA